MPINRRNLIKGSAVAVAALQASQLFPTRASAAVQFARIGSGFGGTYAIFCAKLAEFMNAELKNVHASTMTGGTEQNLILVQRGQAEFSIAYTFHAQLVKEGKGELHIACPDLQHVASVYGSYFVPFMQKNTPMKDLSDVAKYKARVWLSSKSSVLWVMNETALNAFGVTLDQLKAAGGIVDTTAFGNVAESFKDGQLTVAFMSGPQPYSIIMQIDETVGFKPVNFTKEAGEKYTKLLPGTEMRTLKGGTYKSQPNDISVPYVFNQLVTGPHVPEELIYETTKLIYQDYKKFHGLYAGSEDIRPENMLTLNTLPIHAGAKKFYKEVGLL